MDEAFWFQYGDMILDVAMYVGIAAALVYLSKLVHDWKEKRRLRRLHQEYLQAKEDESC